MTMTLCPLDQVLPGTVLGDNVNDAAGRVLLRGGTVMTESSIEALRRRGIEAVPVVVAERAEDVARERLRLETRLQEAFRGAGNGLASRMLRQAAMEFRLGAK